MANITRIKAKDPSKPKPKEPEASAPKVAEAKEDIKNPQLTNQSKKTKRELRRAKRAEKRANRKPMPEILRILTWPFRMLAKPFVALGRYIKASWLELRQVRWPSRKATWKMTSAILIYAAIFLAFIVLIDALFTFIFNNILGA